MTARSAALRSFTGWHMLAAMLAFFGIVIGVNVYLAVEATRTWTGEVVEDDYSAGQEFNAKVKLAREQAALGWKDELSYAAGSIRLAVRDGAGQPIAMKDVAIALTRPIGDSEDHSLPLVVGADGSYTGKVKLTPGPWNVVATAAETPHGAYEQHSRLVVP